MRCLGDNCNNSPPHTRPHVFRDAQTHTMRCARPPRQQPSPPLACTFYALHAAPHTPASAGDGRVWASRASPPCTRSETPARALRKGGACGGGPLPPEPLVPPAQVLSTLATADQRSSEAMYELLYDVLRRADRVSISAVLASTSACTPSPPSTLTYPRPAEKNAPLLATNGPRERAAVDAQRPTAPTSDAVPYAYALPLGS